jgi:hypothetical protein
MAALARPSEELEVLEAETTSTELPAKVILYNDDWHTFEEVIVQLMKATGCSRERAEALTWGGAHARESRGLRGQPCGVPSGEWGAGGDCTAHRD